MGEIYGVTTYYELSELDIDFNFKTLIHHEGSYRWRIG